MAKLQQRINKLAPWGLLVAVVSMLVLGLWGGTAEFLGWYYREGFPPSKFVLFIDHLPYLLLLLLYFGAVLGITTTFFRRYWWLPGLGTYLLMVAADKLTFRIMEATFKPELWLAPDPPIGLFFYIISPPVLAAGLAGLIWLALFISDNR